MNTRSGTHTFPGSDAAFTRTSLYGSHTEHTYSGALSFMRRKYTRDLRGVDVAITGVPFDLATTNRPGTRFGPAAIRAASQEILSWALARSGSSEAWQVRRASVPGSGSTRSA